jgi:hypothetical protein
MVEKVSNLRFIAEPFSGGSISIHLLEVAVFLILLRLHRRLFIFQPFGL